MLRLRIELLSPLCSASGYGRPGAIDRDIVYDPLGLPYLPARRLRGLWRDAYDELRHTAAAEQIPPTEALFGNGGAELPGPLRLGSAQLDSAAECRRWLRGDDHPSLTTEQITACFTELRAQTKIDAELGRAETDTLRTTRVLRCGLVFHAGVSGIDSEEQRMALALGALALQSMGVARNRGLGHVECALEERAEDGWRSLSEGAIEWLDLPRREVQPGAAQPVETFALETGADGDTCRLRYTLHLKQPAVIPAIGGDPFTVRTRDYIAGSTVRGLLARRYLEGRTVDGAFESLFCGRVRFLPCVPCRSGTEGLVPFPASIRSLKSNSRQYVDLGRMDLPEEGLSRVKGWASLAAIEQLAAVEKTVTATELHYHHARHEDRRYERAREDGGALFTYECISSDQKFAGEIVGPRLHLEGLAGLVADGEFVLLGRSRSTEYGGQAEWEWSGKLEKLNGTPRYAGEYDRIVVLVTSPILNVNEHGHYVASFPVGELAAALNTEVENIERQFVRTGWESGYLAHQKLPRLQMPAIEPGSVLVLRLNPPVTAQAMAEAENRAYGLRAEDGYGCIVLQPGDTLGEEDMSAFQVTDEKPGRTPSEKWGEPVRRLALELLRNGVRQSAAQKGLERAGQPAIEKMLAPIHNHLLSRLARMAGDLSLEEFEKALDDSNRKGLREPARRQLRRFLVPVETSWKKAFSVNDDAVTLEQFLFLTCKEWGQTFQWVSAADRDRWQPLFGREPLIEEARVNPKFANETVKLFLLSFLRTLALRKRRMA